MNSIFERSFIYVITNEWEGLFKYLLNWWDIDKLKKYDNGEDLFHDIINMEWRWSKYWCTDVLVNIGFEDGDVIYVNSKGRLCTNKDKDASKKVIHEINLGNCRQLVEELKKM